MCACLLQFACLDFRRTQFRRGCPTSGETAEVKFRRGEWWRRIISGGELGNSEK